MLGKLRQTNREFGTYYPDCQQLMDLSSSRKRLTPEERLRRCNLRLCMYRGGVGHFAVECPARRSNQRPLAGAVPGPTDTGTTSGRSPSQQQSREMPRLRHNRRRLPESE